MNFNISRVGKVVLGGFPLLIAGLFLAACNSPQADTSTNSANFPSYVTQASSQVKEAYQFAVDHPELLQYIPCWCSCGPAHTSNLDCYVAHNDGNGSIDFTSHGANWQICVDITRDVMKMNQEGMPIKEIREAIDAKYLQYGPPGTDTPPPP